ncbi:PhzF family phenazine biosynthesis protein [Roseateles chitinivorans]|uniref:PhzF family phenazine biosynthesis protein n=1 Tax=Roseateles chitinivorans TaxID=2917965 RepID=UPI003D676F5F
MRVFAAADGSGGNPAPIVLDAVGMSDAQMRAVAAEAGHESGFVLPAEDASQADFRFRFFVPRHEMEMCGHATVGALWCLREAGIWRAPRARIETLSGVVEGFVRGSGSPSERIEITQPVGRVEPIVDAAVVRRIADVLRVPADDLLPHPVLNAATSRVKTLVALRSVAALDGLKPDFSRMEALCEEIGSTGLYPFAVESLERRIVHARQFPKSSGYPEDAATGIAAAALLFGLKELGLVPVDDAEVVVHQGRAMGQGSEIHVRFHRAADGELLGCFLGGRVVADAHA